MNLDTLKKEIEQEINKTIDSFRQPGSVFFDIKDGINAKEFTHLHFKIALPLKNKIKPSNSIEEIEQAIKTAIGNSQKVNGESCKKEFLACYETCLEKAKTYDPKSENTPKQTV